MLVEGLMDGIIELAKPDGIKDVKLWQDTTQH